MRALLYALVGVFIGASVAAAQTVQLTKPRSELVVLSNGGTAPWQLQYGTRERYPAVLYQPAADRAYFSHGPWLRLIDVTRGAVIGRWRLPGEIMEITPATGNAVRVRYRLSPWSGAESETIQFDPATGYRATWHLSSLTALLVSEQEASAQVPSEAGGRGWLRPLSPTQARALIPAFEDHVGRDPSQQWIRTILGKLLHDAGDARGRAVMREAVTSAPADFTELFRIAAYLYRIGQRDIGEEAFDAAARDLLARRHDPRLITSVIARIVLFTPANVDATLSERERADAIEHIYRVSPHGDGTELGWRLYAESLARDGQGEAARVWEARAQASADDSRELGSVALTMAADRAALIGSGALLAALLLIVAFASKYRAQRRVDHVAYARGSAPKRAPLLGLAYWSRRERVLVLCVVIVGWYAAGMSHAYFTVMARSAATPIRLGTLAGTEQMYFLANRTQASPARDLLIAIGQHQQGELVDAERRYRALPSFAESWNNLGVIFLATNRADQAREAFARALAIAPQLPEARFNTGGGPSDAGTAMHDLYARGQPMIAIPGRDHFLSAYVGDAWRYRWARAFVSVLDGPLWRAPGGPMALPRFRIAFLLLPAAALAALVLAFFPSREVSQPPGRAYLLLQVSVPGIGLRAVPLALVLLLAWATIVAALVAWVAAGTPYFTTIQSTPDVRRLFVLPVNTPALADALSPNPVWALLALTLSYLVHFVTLRRQRAAARE